jgi:hypothetical protein
VHIRTGSGYWAGIGGWQCRLYDSMGVTYAFAMRCQFDDDGFIEASMASLT